MARREVGEQQAGRVDRDEPNGCMRPYLRRNAFAGDGVCVSSAEKFRIHRENTQSPRKLMNLAFFNGIDTVELDPK
jgi:hypothetical protein